MSKRYVSAEPLTMVRIGEGEAATMAYVFAGQPVPQGADPADVDRLLEEGFLVEEEVADDPAEGDDGPPAKSAAKPDWVAFAVAQGADEAEAEASTKDELIAAYGA